MAQQFSISSVTTLAAADPVDEHVAEHTEGHVEEHGGAHHGVSMEAAGPFPGIPWFTNSMVVTILVTALLVLFCRRATKTISLVPKGAQNLFEAMVEGLYEMFEGIVGKHMIAKCFTLLATIFIFILATNWFGLLPGVGTIGFGEGSGLLSLSSVNTPLLRPASADLNMTLAMALLFMVLWLYWSIQEVGAGSFIGHLFAPKGGLKGALAFALLPIFIFVGLIEIISIAFRPVSLSLRLFGNIFAGETLLHEMGGLGGAAGAPWSFILSVLIPLPFYFLELLVGVLQALVFALLCAVYIQLSTSHDEEEEHHAPANLPH
jgi:F-type H+-transporting ATPase subunit a